MDTYTIFETISGGDKKMERQFFGSGMGYGGYPGYGMGYGGYPGYGMGYGGYPGYGMGYGGYPYHHHHGFHHGYCC
jgi:hypothetical protein